MKFRKFFTRYKKKINKKKRSRLKTNEIVKNKRATSFSRADTRSPIRNFYGRGESTWLIYVTHCDVISVTCPSVQRMHYNVKQRIRSRVYRSIMTPSSVSPNNEIREQNGADERKKKRRKRSTIIND